MILFEEHVNSSPDLLDNTGLRYKPIARPHPVSVLINQLLENSVLEIAGIGENA
ncbi:hypothetical protein XF_0985 [Xylella fastidiosa 9a5c]|uniref:Uncharacterized protein n=1 Tax=Xylella fastidiosa (strain 9a5c) TaxID=160492 RepID=Q9PEP3_XYLFA|nr:hypothetical protein XF_0985 [Xylella fastidiosa 9a5c]